MYFPTTNAEEIVNIVCGMEIRDTDVVLILLGEKDMPDVTRMISGLNESGLKFFGGVFPGLIYDDKKYEQGAVIKVLPALAGPYLIKGLDTEQIEIPDFFSYPNKKYTAMVLVDGLTSNIALFLSQLFDRLGNSVHYFGGGAGSITLKPQPCLFLLGRDLSRMPPWLPLSKHNVNLVLPMAGKNLPDPLSPTKPVKM
ncbi:hypothetical protein KJ849_07655 [bacterium]|nr:hypothetical protein [bacterium]